MPSRSEKEKERRRVIAELEELTRKLKKEKKIGKVIVNQTDRILGKQTNLQKLKAHLEMLRNVKGEEKKVYNLRKHNQELQRRMVSVSIILFCADIHDKRRNTIGIHVANKVELQPHMYVKEDDIENIQGTGETASEYIAEERARNILLPKYMFDELKKRPIMVHRGDDEIGTKEFIQVHDFQNALRRKNTQLWKNKQGKIQNIAFADALDGIMNSKDVVIAVNNVENYVLNDRVNYPHIESTYMERETGGRRLANKLMTYDISEFAETFSDLFPKQQYNQENCCVVNGILEAIAAQYNKYYKKKQLTYETIWNMIHPDQQYIEGMAMPMCWNDIVKVCQEIGIGCHMYNCKGQLLKSYEPPTLNKKVGVRNLMFINKDNHAYFITNKDIKKRLSLTMDAIEKAERPDETVKEQSMTCPKETINACVEDMNEVVDYIVEATKKKMEFVNLVWAHPMPLKDVLKLMLDNNYEPQVGWNSTTKNIVSLSFIVSEVKVRLCERPISDDAVLTTDITTMDKQTTELYVQYRNQLSTTFLCDRVKSKYGKWRKSGLEENKNISLRQLFQTYNRAPISCKFKNDKDYESLDMTKCYAFCLYHLSHIPVLSKFDVMRKYDGHYIEDYTMYQVHMKRASNDPKICVLMNRKYDLVNGFVVKHLLKEEQDIRVLSYIRPHRLVANPYRDVIQKVLMDTRISEKVAKSLLVQAIGKFGQMCKHTGNVQLYRKLEESQRHIDEFGGEVWPVEWEDGSKVYVVQEPLQQHQYIDGFLPIQRAIYDLCRLRVYHTMKKLGSQNVVAVKTDAIFVKKDTPALETFQWKHEINGRSMQSFGQFYRSNDKIREDMERFRFKYETSMPYDDETKVNVITLKDEWKMDEFNEIFDKHPRILVQAKLAGSGKSTACLNYIKGKKHVVVCPQNSSAFNLKKQGFNTMTDFELTNHRVENGKIVANRKQDEETYEVVVFEEVGMDDDERLAMIQDYMDSHPETKFILNGDCKQLPPIVRDFNPHATTFYQDILNRMCGIQIMLLETKRYKGNQGKRIEELWDDCFVKQLKPIEILRKYAKRIAMKDIDKDSKCVSAIQETRRKVNDYIHLLKHGKRDKYVVGQVVRAKERITGSSKDRSKWIVRQYDYKIIEFESENVKLQDATDEEGYIHTLRKTTLDTCFALPYCYTCHSLQGESLDDTIVIFDGNHRIVDQSWVYVAITRCRDLDRVYYCEEGVNAVLDKRELHIMIDCYKHQDRDRMVEEEYIDCEWIVEQSKMQKHQCECGVVMNFQNKPNEGNNMTVQRFDNDLPHIKRNCKLMCYKCNITIH